MDFVIHIKKHIFFTVTVSCIIIIIIIIYIALLLFTKRYYYLHSIIIIIIIIDVSKYDMRNLRNVFLACASILLMTLIAIVVENATFRNEKLGNDCDCLYIFELSIVWSAGHTGICFMHLLVAQINSCCACNQLVDKGMEVI